MTVSSSAWPRPTALRCTALQSIFWTGLSNCYHDVIATVKKPITGVPIMSCSASMMGYYAIMRSLLSCTHQPFILCVFILLHVDNLSFLCWRAQSCSRWLLKSWWNYCISYWSFCFSFSPTAALHLSQVERSVVYPIWNVCI